MAKSRVVKYSFGLLLIVLLGFLPCHLEAQSNSLNAVSHLDSIAKVTKMDVKYIRRTFIDKDGKEVMVIAIPDGMPPSNFKMKKATIASTAKILPVPGYNWCSGCTPTSGAMIAAYYDRTGYPNMYTGPANGGVAPMNNHVWLMHVDYADAKNIPIQQCPLSATMKELDGDTGRGHINDYWGNWIFMDNPPVPDPYITNGWTPHPNDCVADFMKSSQSIYGLLDGWTALDFGFMGSYHSTDSTEGGYGLVRFFESRGYSLTDWYSQWIHTVGVGYDYLFTQYEQEIDAGRPVMLFLSGTAGGHSVVGIGYDDATQTVYFNNTWDYDVHEMPWAGYSDEMQMNMLAVSVYHLTPPSPNPVQLADFKYVIGGLGVVKLYWTTLSETNNYGFEVQKSDMQNDGFISISDLIPGHGTTIEKHEYSFSDLSLGAGRFYRLKQIDLDGSVHYSEALEITTITDVVDGKPTEFMLYQNYPNPFNPSTIIGYDIPRKAYVTLVIFNTLEQEVMTLVNGEFEAGYHEVRLDAGHIASGAYFYRLKAGNFVQTKKFIFLR